MSKITSRDCPAHFPCVFSVCFGAFLTTPWDSVGIVYALVFVGLDQSVIYFSSSLFDSIPRRLGNSLVSRRGPCFCSKFVKLTINDAWGELFCLP